MTRVDGVMFAVTLGQVLRELQLDIRRHQVTKSRVPHW